VHVGILISNGFSWSGPPRSIISLHPGNVSRDLPMGENLAMVPTFLNRFSKVNGNYPATDFWTPGWVHSFNQQWWSSLTLYVLEFFEDDLKQLGLYDAIRATCFRIEISIPTIYTIFELYCLAFGMFLLAQRPFSLVLMMINSCSYSLLIIL